jgi:hypothetical protein
MHESLRMTRANQALKSGRQRPLLLQITSQPVRILTIPCPVDATDHSFHPTSSNTLMPASVSPSHSVNFKTVTVLSCGSGSRSSASSRALCFGIWTRALDSAHGRSATRRPLHCCNHEFASRLNTRMLSKAANDLNVE